MPRLKRTRPTGRTKLEAILQDRLGCSGLQGRYPKRGREGPRYYDIARMLDINPIRLYEYIRGAYEIPCHHLMDLCMFLGLPPDEITGDED